MYPPPFRKSKASSLNLIRIPLRPQSKRPFSHGGPRKKWGPEIQPLGLFPPRSPILYSPFSSSNVASGYKWPASSLPLLHSAIAPFVFKLEKESIHVVVVVFSTLSISAMMVIVRSARLSPLCSTAPMGMLRHVAVPARLIDSRGAQLTGIHSEAVRRSACCMGVVDLFLAQPPLRFFHPLPKHINRN